MPEHEPARCDAALKRAFTFLGKRWNGVLLGSLAAGPMSYTELHKGVEGISPSVLSDRLVELCGAGLVLRQVDEGPPISVSYRLAPAGEKLVPVLNELSRWAAGNLPGEVVEVP